MELSQSIDGYRYSIDSFILADFVKPAKESKIIDFGTGNGIIPLLLTHKTSSKIIGLDIQSSLLSHARFNIAQNSLEKQITLIQGDIRFSKSFLKTGYFDIVVTNPPYRKLKSGRLNPNSEKAISRHEIIITLPELIENAANLLSDSGKLDMIYIYERYNELISILEKKGFFLKKIRLVCSNRKSEPKMFLVEAVKKTIDSPHSNGETRDGVVLDPLYIYDSNGAYTPEMQGIYDFFND